MSDIQAIRLQTAGFSGLQAIPLKDGSFVAVNVLKNNGNGSYLISFAGSRFNVKSKVALEPGEKFLAKLSVQENKVFLTPQKSLNQIEETENSNLLNKTQNAELVKILLEYGLVPDSITIKIMQFLQQGNFSLDKNLMQKARLIALNFPGNEKKAAEIAISLFEKGVNANVQIVKKFLDSMFVSDKNPEDSPREQQDSSQAENSAREQKNSSQAENSSREQKNFSQAEDFAREQKNSQQKQKNQNLQILVKNLFGSVPENSPGLLSLFNQISEKSDKHWILLPYEWNFTRKNGKSVKTSGFIRLLLNKSLKTVEKISVNCDVKKSSKKWTNYFFVLYLNSSKVKEVRFCTLPALLTSQISFEERRLGELFSSGMNLDDSVTVTYSPLTLIEGLFSDSEIPLTFNKLV